MIHLILEKRLVFKPSFQALFRILKNILSENPQEKKYAVTFFNRILSKLGEDFDDAIFTNYGGGRGKTIIQQYFSYRLGYLKMEKIKNEIVLNKISRDIRPTK